MSVILRILPEVIQRLIGKIQLKPQKKVSMLRPIIKTKNCEDNICNTLESIKEFDEIIILDEHSTDDTVEIAKEYKTKTIFTDKNIIRETKIED